MPSNQTFCVSTSTSTLSLRSRTSTTRWRCGLVLTTRRSSKRSFQGYKVRTLFTLGSQLGFYKPRQRNEQHPDFDAVFARRAVWLSLNRFAKAPLCVKKDHDLALAALLEGAVKPEHLGPCWDDHAFVTRNIHEIAPQYVLCAPNLTPSLAALALNVVRQELESSLAKHQGAGDAYSFLDMVHKACLVFPNDASIAQACLFRLSARNLNRDCQTFNARVAETWRRAFHHGANLDVVCCFARSARRYLPVSTATNNSRRHVSTTST